MARGGSNTCLGVTFELNLLQKLYWREILDRYVGVVLAGGEVFRFLEQNRAAVQGLETGKDRFARFRDHPDRLVDLLAGPDAPLRDRVRHDGRAVSRRDVHVLPAAGRRPGQARG